MHSILIIDDDADIAAVAARGLRQSLGAEVSVSSSVADAISRLAAGEPDLVILDLALDANPEPLHVALRTRGVPVLLVSRDHPEQLESVALRGGWEYLAWPYNPAAFVRTVRGLLNLPALRSDGFTPVVPMGLGDSGIQRLPAPDTTAPQSVAPAVPVVAVNAVAAPGAAVNVVTPPAPTPVPPSVQIVDKLGEIVAVLVIGFLCIRGRVEGVDALVAIGAVLGIQVVPRALSAARGAGAAVGVVGMILLAALGGLTPAAATELEPLTPQTSGQHRALRGFATITVLSLVTLAAAASIAVAALR